MLEVGELYSLISMFLVSVFIVDTLLVKRIVKRTGLNEVLVVLRQMKSIAAIVRPLLRVNA